MNDYVKTLDMIKHADSLINELSNFRVNTGFDFAGISKSLADFSKNLKESVKSCLIEYDDSDEPIIETLDIDTIQEIIDDEFPIHAFCQAVIKGMDGYEFREPYEYFLEQRVRIVIKLDTGDGKYNYTLNRLREPDATHPAPWIHKDSSALWLAKQHGISKEQLETALQMCPYNDFSGYITKDIKDPFLRELCEAILHITCGASINYGGVGQLFFLAAMSMRELLLLHTAMKKGVGSITVKDAVCGLFDKYHRFGRIMEEPVTVTIPTKFIASAEHDWSSVERWTSRDHDILRVYGVSETFQCRNGYAWRQCGVSLDIPQKLMDQLSRGPINLKSKEDPEPDYLKYPYPTY